MGRVYRARDARLNRDVAIKVILPRSPTIRRSLARFEREDTRLRRLPSNILTIFDVGHSDGRPFAVMECSKGKL
jgi:serine/threonine-protein kinase